MAKNDNEQPDYEDTQAIIDWISDDKADVTERQLRANSIYGQEIRRTEPRGGVMNAISDARSLTGPPSANQ